VNPLHPTTDEPLTTPEKIENVVFVVEFDRSCALSGLLRSVFT